MAIADRIVVLDGGRVQQSGPPRELYERPANPFVMKFLGPVSSLGDRLVRPHDLLLSAVAGGRRGRGDGHARGLSRFRGARGARAGARGRGLGAADTGRGGRARGARGGHPPRARAGVQRVTQESGSLASRSILPGSVPWRGPRSVTCSTTSLRLVLHGDPDALQRLRGACVVHRLRPLAPHGGERAVDGADDVGDRDLLRRPRACGRPPRLAGWWRCRRGAGRRGCSPGTAAGCPGRSRSLRRARVARRPGRRRARRRHAPHSRPWRRPSRGGT